MKKYLLLLIAAATLTVSSAYANPTLTNLVTITQASDHSPNGGEFLLTSDGGASFTSFDTFCIEINQNVSMGSPYTYTIDNGSDGGVGPKNSLGLTPVSIGTAWLYSQFREGNLNNNLDQNSLQDAIWYCQGEKVSSEDSTFNVNNNQYILDAEKALNCNNNATALLVNGQGAYGVDVWNLYSGTTECQSQLGIQTTPEPTTMALIGMGGLSLFMIRRRK